MYLAQSKKFGKQYKKLPKRTKEQFTLRLKLYLNDQRHPLLYTHNLSGQYKDFQSFNVSADIRAVFHLVNEDKLLFIAIGFHNELFA